MLCAPRRIVAAVMAATLALQPLAGLAQQTDGRDLELNFDQIDVRTFVKVVGEFTGKRFIVDEKVQGKITVVSPKIAAAEVLPVFMSILESVGCSLVKEGENVYRVVSVSPRVTPSAAVVGPGESAPAVGIVTKVLRLQYVQAAEMRKVLEPRVMGGKEGAVVAIESTNHLIVTDKAENLARIEKIVQEVDRPGSARGTELVTLKFASAADVADQLTRAMSEGMDPATRERFMRRGPQRPDQEGADSAKPVVVVAAPHSNSLILVGSAAQIEELKRVVALMDVDSPSGRGNLNAIFLKYIAAEDAAKSLNALFARKASGARPPGAPGAPSGTQPGVFIEPHAINNVLLVDAAPRDMEVVRQLITDLDKPPQQVLILVMIAEVSLQDQSDIGFNMVALDMPKQVGGSALQGSVSAKEGGASALMGSVQNGLFPDGIALGLSRGVRERADGTLETAIPAAINIDAMQRKGNFHIMSRVPLLAQDNKAAEVSIVNNIPMLKSTVQAGTGSARDIIQNIDRVDVGMKLKLTPHINPKGEVRMELNPSIEAITDPGRMADNLAPTIAKREVNTTVTVPDGETIILSGLIREDKTKTVRKIPLLGSIPLLGLLFRHTVEGTEKTNLIVLVTPHIITDYNMAKSITDAWNSSVAPGTTNAVLPGLPGGARGQGSGNDTPKR